MIDSKNMIWLGSFFSLLLIVFCVSKHLDDLNPRIANLDSNHHVTSYQSDNQTSQIIKNQDQEEDETKYMKDVLIEDISNKSQEKSDLNSETKVLETDRLHIEPREVAKPKEEVEKRVIKKRDDKKEIKKSKKSSKRDKKKLKKLVYISDRGKLITKVALSKEQISKLKSSKEVAKLNKIGYKFSLSKSGVIFIKSPDKRVANMAKSYLQNRGIPSKSIIIVIDKKNQQSVELILRERR